MNYVLLHASCHLLCCNVYFSVIKQRSLFFIIEILCYGSKNDDFIMPSDDNALSSLWTLLSENAEAHFEH